ncbi:hypothetical protein [Sulfobacillus harzensis]|uniref:MFS transporter n=1 Tax=Sulfobacillus harzensis TaxID=2729629 RepID=A0A7Y0Q400_9FIRM|nr:hypothetical protein [Sulfobacillus harzensis]NMP24092.1 MFS transporter [Sulfobacillus harzensis]
MAWMGSYLTLFLVDEHLAPHEVGLALGIGAFVQVLGLGLSGALARRIGRKASIMGGDFLGWVVVLGVWALSHNPLWLALAMVLNQAMGFVGPAWNSLFSAGEDPVRLPRYFFLLQLATVLGGLVLPLMRGWIARHGVVYTGHHFLWIVWPAVATAWLTRLILLKEARPESNAPQHERLSALAAHLRQGLAGTGAVLAGLRIMIQVPLVLFTNLAPLALVSPRGAHLLPERLAWLPLAALVSALSLLVVQSRTDGRHSRILTGLAILWLGLGFLILALSRSGHFWWVMAAWALIIAGQSQFWTSHTSFWMSWLPDAIRVDVQGWIGVVTAGLVAILSPVMAPVFAHSPRPLFEGAALLSGFALLLWRFLPGSPDVNAPKG